MSAGAARRGALEKRQLDIGVMPLLDAAPIVVAQRLGHFAEHGLTVQLRHERAWASVRDKLVAGTLDAAPLLAPMPLAATLGIDGLGAPMCTALVLSRNGNGITLARALHDRVREAHAPAAPLAWAGALRAHLAHARGANARPLTLAHVFPFSCHAYQLRYWLAAGGIDVGRDVHFVVAPPSQMNERLRDGRIDGFCVGAPWSAVCQAEGLGVTVARSAEIWPDSVEKVLGVTRAWANANPNTHVALVRALLGALDWLRDARNHDDAARMLAAERVLDAPRDLLHAALAEISFDGAHGRLPRVSEFLWLGSQMQRWGQLDGTATLRAAATLTCADDVHAHATGTQADAARGTTTEGVPLGIEGPWFDGVRFDAATLAEHAPS